MFKPSMAIDHRLLRRALAWVTFSVMAVYVCRPLLRSGLSPIDDHEFVRFGRTTDGLLGVFRTLFDQTEVGSWGTSTRYRPLYYFLRVLSPEVLGNQGGSRYFIRIVITIVVCLLLATLVIRMVQLVFPAYEPTFPMQVLLPLMFFSLSAWQDIVTRLGPSELLLILGLAITWLCTARIIGSPSPPLPKTFFLLLIGVFIAAGSKENGVIAALPVALVLLTNGLPLRRRRTSIIGLSVVLSWTAWIFIGTYLAVRKVGVDVYGRPATTFDFVTSLWDALHQNWFIWSAISILILLFLTDPSGRRRTACLAGLLLASAVLDFVVYRGQVLSPRRYFVVIEAVTAALLAAGGISAGVRLARSLALTGRRGSLALLAALIVVSSQITNVPRNIESLAAASRERERSSDAWEQTVDQVSGYITTGGYTQVIVTSSPAVYEFTAALIQFLAYDHRNVSFFLEPGEAAPTDPLQEALVQISTLGYSNWHVQPYRTLDAREPTLCLLTEPGASVYLSSCDEIKNAF